MTTNASLPAESTGHITFAWDNSTEFFQRGEDVYRAPTSDPVMTDGYRCGRWVSSRTHFDRFRAVVLYTA